MKITFKLAKEAIKKFYLRTIGFTPRNKDIIVKDINGEIINASINGQHRQFRINVAINIDDITNLSSPNVNTIAD